MKLDASEKAKEPQKKKKKKGVQIYLNKVSPDDVEFSLRQLGMMLKSGMPILEALDVTVDQASDDRLKEAYKEIYKDAEAGQTLASSMAKHDKIFSQVVISIVKVSEQTGTLENNLMFLADYIKKNYDLQKKVKGALIYPVIVLALTVAEMIGMIYFILPKLETLFKTFENIPAFTRFVVNAAGFIRSNVLYMLLGSALLVFLLTRLVKTKPGKRTADKIMISFPIIKKLTKGQILSNFSRTLGMLLESSIPIADAIEIAAQTIGNTDYEKALKEIHKDVKGGQNLADSMIEFSRLFPISYVRIIEAGERTGTLEENLAYLYESYTSEVEEMSNNLVTLIEPLLLIFAGAMIGLLTITIIAPIYQFTSSIN